MGLRSALAFLTRLQVGGPPTAELGRAAAWFPAVGLLLGGLLFGCDELIGGRLPPRLTAALLLAILVALTGALHLDGLADMADGLGSGRRGEEAYRIVKDPHIGAFGVIALLFVLLIDVEALAILLSQSARPERRLLVLLLGPATARLAMVIGARLGRSPDYVTSGLGHTLIAELRWSHVLWATATLLVAALLLAHFGAIDTGVILLIVGAGLFGGLLTLAQCKTLLGGVTGDGLGAACEVAQATTWLLAAAACR